MGVFSSLRSLSLLVFLAVVLLSLYSTPTVSADGAPIAVLGAHNEHLRRGDEHKHINRPCKEKDDEREECRSHHEDKKDVKRFHPTGFEHGELEAEEHRDRRDRDEYGEYEPRHDHRGHQDKHHRREQRHDFRVRAVVTDGDMQHDDKYNKHHHHHKRHYGDSEEEEEEQVYGQKDEQHDRKHKHKHEHKKHDKGDQYGDKHQGYGDQQPDDSEPTAVAVEGHKDKKDRCMDERYYNDYDCKQQRGEYGHKHQFELTGHREDRDREAHCKDHKNRHDRQCRKDKHGHYFLPKFIQALVA